MNKVLIGVLGLLAVLVAAVVAVPSFIDWNEHKSFIAERVKDFTGREIVIGGDIRIAVLPAPALVAFDVALKNLPGAASPSMARVKALEIRIALGPLLTGNVQVDTVRLVEPAIDLEILADGRKNWNFSGSGGQGSGRSGQRISSNAAGGEESAFPLRLDRFVVDRGSVTYRDSRSGTVEHIDNINARIAAASLSGPVESSGQLTVRGLPLKYEANFGKIIQERTMPFSVAIEAAPGSAKLQLNGTLLSLGEQPRLKGRLKAEGKDLAVLLASQGVRGEVPGFLAQGFGIDGEIQASMQGAEVKDIALRLGDTQAKGTIDVDLSKATSLVAKFNVTRIDLDAWLKMPPQVPKVEASTVDGRGGRASIAIAPQGRGSSAGFAIPDDLDGAVAIAVDAVSFKGDLIRDLRLNAELGGGALTVNQIAAQFPGSSDLFVTGFVTAEKGEPRFEGQLEATVNDTRSVLRWLGVSVPSELPTDRLRKLTYKSGLVMTREQVQVAGIDLAVDNSRLSGGVTVALRERPAFGASLTVNRINLDGYVRPEDTNPSAGPNVPAASPQGGGGSPVAGSGGAAPVGAWQALNAFDANMKLQVNELTYNRTPIKDFVFDGTLHGGILQLRRLSVVDMAGTSATLAGTVKGLDGVPSFDRLTLASKSSDVTRLLRFLGASAPAVPARLGAVTVEGRLDGSLLGPTVDLAIGAAGGRVSAKGKLSLLTLSSDGDIALKVDHPDLTRLLAALESPYRPTGRIGAVDLSAVVRAGVGEAAFSGISGKLGVMTVAGTAKARYGGAKPQIGADLSLGDVRLSDLMPAERQASLPVQGGIVPASWPTSPAPAMQPLKTDAAFDGRWSKSPLDLSGLQAVDADVKARAETVTYDSYRLQNVDLAMTVKDGLLKAERLTGTLFGGTLKIDAQVASAQRPGFRAGIVLSGADVTQAIQAVAGSGVAGGRMDLSTTLSAEGGSVEELVAALSGNGSIALKQLDVKGRGQGSALAGFLGVVGGLNQLGGREGAGLADLTGTFKVDKGVARTGDLKLAAAAGNGTIVAAIDLLRWQIDAVGDIALGQNLLTALLGQRMKIPDRVPIKVKGRLDAPTVTFDTGPSSTPSQPQQQQPRPTRPSAEDVLKDVLRNIR